MVVEGNNLNYLHTPLRLLTILGQWPPTSLKNTTFYLYLYHVYTFIMVILVTVMFASSENADLINLIITGGNVNTITNNLTHAVSHTLGVFKNWNVLIKRRQVRFIIDTLENNETIKYEKYGEFVPEQIIKKAISKITLSTYTLGFFASNFILMGALAPIFNKADYYYAEWDNKTLLTTRPLPISTWFPFDTRILTNYYIAYSYQIIGIFGIAWMIVCLDNVFVGLMIQIKAQCEILNGALMTLRERTLIIVQSRTDTNSNNYSLKQKYEEEIIKQVKKCIKHHQVIISLKDILNKTFDKIILAQFVAGLIILCVSLFQCATRPLSMDFFYMLGYLITISCQLFLYCWFGNEILIESSLIPGSIYMNGWADEGKSLKKNLLIMMARGQKPIMLTACGFTPVTLETYTNILNGAYSYFAILKQIYAK